MRTLAACIVLSLAGCDPAAVTPDDPEEEPPVCGEIVTGRWAANKQAFGMPMDLDITFDPAACEFYASEWSVRDNPSVPMSHSDRMLGGTLAEDDTVELFGTTDRWSACTGTVEDDGTRIEGTCETMGDFELLLKP